MPLYEYECLSCGCQFQYLIMKRGQEEDITCPECGDRKIKKNISRAAYHVSEKDLIASYKSDTRRDPSFNKKSGNIGLAAKKMALDMGVDLGKTFEDKLEKLRSNPLSSIKERD